MHRVSEGGWTADRPEPLERSVHRQALASVQRALDVEPRLAEIIQEVLQHYDVDGVELDFLRAPIYFRTAYLGQPTTDAQRGVLTRLVRRIRTLILSESEKRGKPLLLGLQAKAYLPWCVSRVR